MKLTDQFKNLLSNIAGRAREMNFRENLPIIYIRPTQDGRIAVWPGDQMDVDPRPNEYVIYFKTIKDAEEKLPQIMEATGKYFGVMYIYIDNMEEK